ncbi:MAG: TylF/MycF/NovP-related O-methyltransferase [Patescibacteria group bacterium]
MDKVKFALNKIFDLLGYRIFKKQKDFHYIPDIYGKNSRKMNDIRSRRDFFSAAKKVIDEKKTSLYYDRLFYLYEGLANSAKNNSDGILDILEIGVNRGGSSYFLAEIARNFFSGKINMYSVDTFEGHSEKDLAGEGEGKSHKAHHYSETTSFETVLNYLSGFPFVKVLKGRIQDRAEDLVSPKFNFIHLDVDIYEPTVWALEFFSKRMKSGGIIIVDDYGYITCPGVKKAVDAFYEKEKLIKVELQSGQCMLIFPF